MDVVAHALPAHLEVETVIPRPRGLPDELIRHTAKSVSACKPMPAQQRLRSHEASDMMTYTNKMSFELETCEMAAWFDFYNAASALPAKNDLPCAVTIDGALATRASNADVLALNRVVGLGLRRAATDEQIDRLIRFYAEAGVPRFFLQLSPDARPADIPSQLVDKGFRLYNNWVKLYRDTAPPPSVPTDLTVRRIKADQAQDFGRIAADSFSWPAAARDWIAGLVTRQGWHHYLAFDGRRPVATGALFIDGDQAWLDFAATLPEYRGRGAQASLLARRIADAADLGCHLLVVETAEETPFKGAPSLRNTRRFGFQVAYVRPNYIYNFAS